MRGRTQGAGGAAVRFDAVLLLAVFALVATGLVMVYSASAILAFDRHGDSLYFFKRQLIAAGLGLVAMAAAMKVGWRRMARLAYPLLLLTLALLVVVLIPGLGTAAGGARRWIRFPGISIQPAEIAKLTWVIYLAYSLAKKREKVATFSVGFLPHLLLCGLLVGLCMKQPDFGSSVLLVFVLFALLFAAGTRVSFLVFSVLAALPLAYLAVARSAYRMERIQAFLDPWKHRHDVGYQLTESLMSVGSGGLFGLGLGDGRQKLYFLPEAHTDFIFAIIGEELGLVGVTVVVALYGVVLWRGIRAALAAPEPFGTYLGLGVTAVIAFQAFVNMSVAMGILPTKGLTLPFISYGGTSLIVQMGAAGILLSLSAATAGAREGRGAAASSLREVAA